MTTSNHKSAPARPASRNRALAIAIAATAALSTLLPQPATATVGDARREVERVVDELDSLQEQADILAEDYNEAIDNKSQLDGEITKLEEKVAGKEADLDSLQGDLAEVALRSFTGADGGDLMGPLFGDTVTYTNGLRRDQLSRVALNVGTGTTDDLDVLLDQLNDEQKELDAKRAEAAALAEQIKQQQAAVQSRTEEYKQKRADAEARLGKAIAEEEARRAQEAYNRMLAEQAAAQQASAARPSSNNSGGGNAVSAGGASSSGGGQASNAGATPAPAAPAPAASASAPAPKQEAAPKKSSYSSPSVSGLAGVAVSAAMAQQGKKYVYATAGPDSFDCSGLTHYAWAQAGVNLPRNSRAQYAALPHVDPANAQPGDLIFFYSPISHVGLYLGGGQMVHAPNSGSNVKVSSVSWNKVTGVGRPG